MPLFRLAKNLKADKLETDNRKERGPDGVQSIFEGNLPAILSMDFLAHEYVTSSGRIDTLAIDRTGSPVIIEYKRTQNDNVINQGISYLKWLLDHKADFEKLCREKNANVDDIDWTSPRLICVAQSYSKFDLDTAEFLPMKIELLKYTSYDGDLLYVDKESQKAARGTSKVFEKAGRSERIRPLQESYSVDGHLQAASEQVREIFLKFQESTKSLDDSIVEEAKKKYIAYKLTTNFVDIVVQKNALKIFLNMPSGKLNDPYNMARDLTKPKVVGHWGNGDYEVLIKNAQDLEKAFELIKQSYNYNK